MSVNSRLFEVVRQLSAWVLPEACLLCRQQGQLRHGLCTACSTTLPCNTNCCRRCALPMPLAGICGACLKRPPGYLRCLAPLRYEWPVDDLIGRLKFGGELAMAECLGGMLSTSLDDAGIDGFAHALLVPVPLSTKRLRERGFNQAQLLAETLRSRWQLQAVHALRRIRDTDAQSGLGALARRRNVRRAFVADARELAGRDVVLIDDVVTTGATVRECTRALLDAGAARVLVLAVARASEPGRRA